MSYNFNNLFLDSPMNQPDYMGINMNHWPPDIIQQNILHEKLARDGYVYIKTKKWCAVLNNIQY